MSGYTVRAADTLDALAAADTLDEAVEALETERLAFLLNPPPRQPVLDLVVTADDTPGQPGDIVVRFAAGPAALP